MLEEASPSFQRLAAWLLALQAMAAGDPPGAHRWLCTTGGEEERASILPLFPPDPTDEIHLVRIALATGDHELAAGAVANAVGRSQLNPGVRTLAATAAHASGLLHGSEPELARAVELFADSPRPLALASALEDLGAAQIQHGVGEGAIESLSQALTLYRNAGASWDAARVRRRLRARGVRRRYATASPRPQAGWGAMTETELNVARLVAHGLTNREIAGQLFVSPHTVNSHLRQIFAKVGVTSRVALTRMAGEHDAGGVTVLLHRR
jgi:DNA-binding CsgD family transcriptional regulator